MFGIDIEKFIDNTARFLASPNRENRRSFVRRSSAIGLAIFAADNAIRAGEIHADSRLGGLNNLLQQCQARGYDTIVLEAPLSSTSWKCGNRANLADLDMNRACRDQYGTRDAFARAEDSGNPYSWVCRVS